MPKVSSPTAVWTAWLALGSILFGFTLTLTLASGRFDYVLDIMDQPSLWLAAGLIGAGLVYCLLLPLLVATDKAGLGADWRLLALIAVFGLGFRFALFPSTPAIEDDWYRYLWDGAVSSHGYNPYAVSPDDAQGDIFKDTLQPLAHQSGVVIERINHSDLKTIYPPVAQGAFALAHMIEPWSLRAWRLVCLLAEVSTLALILALLRDAGRSQAWAALYWWNPVVVKELFNSAHMEAVLMPFLVASVLFAVRGRFIACSAALGVAAGVKLWPVFLAPILFRGLVRDLRHLLLCVSVLVVLVVIWALPPLIGGVGETSGFVAYAQHWHTNSAHYLPIEMAVGWAVSLFSSAPGDVALVVRGLLAACLAAAVVWLARPESGGTNDLVMRVYLAIAALLLLSPAQFPWYLIWLLPFFAVWPQLGPFAITVLIPIYYVSFHYLGLDQYKMFATWFVWGIWIPVWIAFALDWRRGFRPLDQPPDSGHA